MTAFAAFADRSSKGAWGELVVLADLLRRGVDSYVAASPSASCDLIALIGVGLPHRIEVRCATDSQRGGLYVLMPQDPARYDVLAVVTPSGVVHYMPPLPGDKPSAEIRGKGTLVELGE